MFFSLCVIYSIIYTLFFLFFFVGLCRGVVAIGGGTGVGVYLLEEGGGYFSFFALPSYLKHEREKSKSDV